MFYSILPDLINGDLYDLVDEFSKSLIDLSNSYLLPHVRKDLYEQYDNWILECEFYPIKATMYEMINNKVVKLPDDFSPNGFSKNLYGMVLVITKD